MPTQAMAVYLSDWRPARPSESLPPEPSPAPAQASAAEATPAEPDSNVDERAAGVAGADADAEPDDIADPPVPTQRRIDWFEEARRAAARMRAQQARSNGYVTFGYPVAVGTEPGLRSRSGQEPVAPNGPLERDSFGEVNIPLGDGCYLIAGGGSILVEDAFILSDYKFAGRRSCSRPSEPRNELFIEQKPDYLD